MSQIVKLRRSATPGNKPTTSQLDLGELAINTNDGKIYFEKSSSTEDSIQEIITTGTWNTGSVSISGSLTVTGSFIANGLTYPTIDNGEFSFIQTDGLGNLTLQYVNTMYETVHNEETSSIPKGTPLYISGSNGANAQAFFADAGNPNRMPVTYIAGDNIAPGQTGRAIVLGLIAGVDTTGYPAGTEVYVGVGGGWTATRPTGSAIVQVLGIVTKEGSGGQGIVLNPGPANLPNLRSGSLWIGNSSSVPTVVTTSSIVVDLARTASYALSTDNVITGSANQVAIFSSDKNITGSNRLVNVGGDLYIGTSNNYLTENIRITTGSGAQNDLGYNSIGIGRQVLYNNTTGYNNTALGTETLYSNTEGIGNVAVGRYGLRANTSGFGNVSLGTNVLYNNTTGNTNIGIGYLVLANNNIGSNNIGIGVQSLLSNTSGENNVAIGPFTLNLNTIGNQNTAIGGSALNQNTTGGTNVAVGRNAMFANSVGSSNVALGDSSLSTNTSGSNNTALGFQSLLGNTTGNSNVGIGSGAGREITTGTGNVAIGTAASLLITGSASNTVVIGNEAGYNNKGNSIVAIGSQALYGSTGGNLSNDIVAIGQLALSRNTSGSSNIALGSQVLSFNTIGNSNIGIGNLALYSNVTGSDNIGIGTSAGVVSTSNNNIFIGTETGYSITTNGNNVHIGYQAGKSAVGASNILIGNLAGNTNTLGENVMLGHIAGINNTGTRNTFVGYTVAGNNNGSYNTIIGVVDTPTSNESNTLVLGDGQGNIKLYSPSTHNILIGTTTDNTINKLQISGSVIAYSYTGSLFGTASFATNALTASYIATASYTPNLQEVTNQGATTNLAITSSGLLVNGTASITGPVITNSVDGFSLLSGTDTLFSLGYIGGTLLDRLASTNFFIAENGSPQFTIIPGGNIGIGTTSPTGKLTIVPYVTSNSSSIEFTNSDNAVISSYYSQIFAVDNTNTQSGRQFVFAKGGKGYGTQTKTMMVIDADSSNVGIGTTSPAYKLHLYETSSSNARMYIQGATNFVATEYGNTGGTMWTGIDDSTGGNFTGTAYKRFIYSAGAYDFGIYTNGVERLTISSGGAATFASSITTNSNLNIVSGVPYIELKDTSTNALHYVEGTDTGLDIWADSNQSGSNSAINFKVDGNTTRMSLSATDLNATVNATVGDGTDINPDANGSGQLGITGNGYRGYVALNATAMYVGHNSAVRNLTLQTDETDRLTITGNGDVGIINNLGIGTISPGAKLEVNAGTNLITRTKQLVLDNFSDDGIGITFTRTSSDSEVMAIGVADTDKFGIFSREGIIFGTGGSTLYSAVSEAMRITTAGDVGIGTTTPISKFQIGGTTGNLLSVGTLTNNWAGNVAIGIENGNGVIISKINTTNDTNRVLLLYRDDTNGASIYGYTPGGTSTDIGFLIRANASSYFNGGSVGIGNSSPSSFGGGGLTIGSQTAGKSLVINSTSDGNNGLIQFVSSGSSDALQIFGATNENGFYGYGNRSMDFYTNGTKRLTLTNAGDLIHTGNATITGSVVTNGKLTVNNNSGISILTSPNFGLNMYFDGNTGYSYIDSKYDSAGAGRLYIRTRTNGTPVNALYFLGTGVATFGNNVIINNGGLTVTGSNISNSFVDQANTFALNVGAASSTPNWVSLGTSGTGIPHIQGYNNGFSTTTNLVLQPNGSNVGIGMTPYTKFDVNGPINTTPTSGYTLGATSLLPNSAGGFYHTTGDTTGAVTLYANLGSLAFSTEGATNTFTIAKTTGAAYFNGTLTSAGAAYLSTNAGVLGLGTTSPTGNSATEGLLHVNAPGSSYSEIHLTNTTTGTTGVDGCSLIMYGTKMYLVNFENDFMSLGTNNIERLRITAAGDTLITGSLNVAAGSSNLNFTSTGLYIGSASAAPSTPTNGTTLYSEDIAGSSELKVIDEAGNITTLSPHNFSLIPEGPSEELAWSYYSENNGKKINVDMLKLARLLEKLTGEKLVYTE